MSKAGINIAAKIFTDMQNARQELFRMGTHPTDHQDILLAQMLSDGNDAMKDAFMHITSGNFPNVKSRKARKIKSAV